MIRTQIRKLSNPRRVSVKRRSNAQRKKRKMSPKQIRIFGTKRQKAALKASRKRKAVSRNPRRVRVHRAPVKRRTKRSSNPALIVTLGAMNPHRKKRRNTVAKAKVSRRRRRTASTNRRRTRRSNPVMRRVRRRRSNPVARRRTRRRSNPKVVVRYRNRRRSNPRRHHSRRNPSLFGTSITSKEGMMILGGGLAGVAAAKFIPTMLPASITGGIASSNIGKVVLTGVSAIAAGMLASRFVNRGFGNGVMFGGLMQTASVALNGFLPSVYQQLGIGLGEIMPGSFTVPQNPIRAGIAPPAPVQVAGGQARINMNGLSRVYGNAY